MKSPQSMRKATAPTLRVFKVRTDGDAVRAMAELDQKCRQEVERRQREREARDNRGDTILDNFLMD